MACPWPGALLGPSNGKRWKAGKTMSYHKRLLHRDLPAGILSIKDALDDGNAYDSATRAAVTCELMRHTRDVKLAPSPLSLCIDRLQDLRCGVRQAHHEGIGWLSLPLRERKDFLGFSLFAKSLENPSEGETVLIKSPLLRFLALSQGAKYSRNFDFDGGCCRGKDWIVGPRVKPEDDGEIGVSGCREMGFGMQRERRLRPPGFKTARMSGDRQTHWRR
jgi:hypothetical protein